MALGMLHYATHTLARIFAPRPFDFLGDARAVVNQAPSGLGPSGFHPCRERSFGPCGSRTTVDKQKHLLDRC